MTDQSRTADYGMEHANLWNELRDAIALSISPPEQARYAANRLMAWPEGQDLLRRIVAHLDSAPDGRRSEDG